VVTIQDITETKAWEAQQFLLLQELSHRVKNSLTVVLSMARQRLRNDTSPEALQKYEHRLLALSEAHDLLVQTDWKGAKIGSLVYRLLATYAASSEGRITIDGPELLLPPDVATPLAMVVEELATNAAKYGALGEKGKVPSLGALCFSVAEGSWNCSGRKAAVPLFQQKDAPALAPISLRTDCPTQRLNSGSNRRAWCAGLNCR